MSQRKQPSQVRRNSKRHSSDKTKFGFNSASKANASTPSEDIVARSVRRSGLPYDSFVRLIIQTALSRLTIWNQSDLERLLLTTERLGLDPLSNEIYALEKQAIAGKKAQIIFVVGVDGWTKIINSHPAFDGMKFVESEPGDDELPLYIECTIFRKDRRVAASIREYMYEAHTGQGAWLTHPRRMLRHKAMVQCARVCFGLSGICDPDEAFRVSRIHETRNFSNSNKAPSSSYLAKHPPSGEKTLGTKFVKTWVSNFPDGVRPSTTSSPASVDTHQGL
jgi:hypothetical protein